MDQGSWSDSDRQDLARAKRLLTLHKIAQASFLRDGELLRIIYGPITPYPDDALVKGVRRFYEYNSSLDFSLTQREITALDTGCISILGVDQSSKPVILFDITRLPSKDYDADFLGLVPKILALVRMKMHVPGKIEMSKYVFNIGSGLFGFNKDTMRGFITRIAAFENQFDELVLLNGNWLLKGLTKALEGMGVLDANITYKMTTVNDDEIPRKLQTFLPAELIPAEYGGKRTKTLSWPPDY
jgi:hypothetical protein